MESGMRSLFYKDDQRVLDEVGDRNLGLAIDQLNGNLDFGLTEDYNASLVLLKLKYKWRFGILYTEEETVVLISLRIISLLEMNLVLSRNITYWIFNYMSVLEIYTSIKRHLFKKSVYRRASQFAKYSDNSLAV